MKETGEKLVLTVEQARLMLGISRGLAYEAIRRREIPSIRIGRRILIPRAGLERMIEVATKPGVDVTA